MLTAEMKKQVPRNNQSSSEVSDESVLLSQSSYPYLPPSQLAWKVTPRALKTWQSLGPFVYNDAANECKTCDLRPLTAYLDKGYYLG